MFNKINNYLDSLYFDTRSMGLFRVFIGLSVLYNLVVIKFGIIKDFYGKERLFSSQISELINGAYSYSIFDLIHNDLFAYSFWAICVVSTVLLIIGFYSRVFSVITLVMYWNFVQANSGFSFGFDFFTFHILFWACFLPLDNFLAIKKPDEIPWVNQYVVLAFLIQIAWVYFSTGIVKYGISWREGFAIRNMLLDSSSATSLSFIFAENKFLYFPLTYITKLGEILFPLFVFPPFRFKFLRMVGVLFLFGFHFLIFLLFDVGNFSITGISVAFLLIPSSFWDKWLKFGLPVNTNFSKKSNVILKLLAFFAIFIITFKNIVFISQYSSPEKPFYIHFFSKVDFNLPLKTSFSMQHWKMFAPNPPDECGWYTLEYLGEDGLKYDAINEELVTNYLKMPYSLKGGEYFLYLYSRGFVYKKNGYKFRLFLRYWFQEKIKNKQNKIPIEKIYFVNYRRLVQNQSIPSKPIIVVQSISLKTFLESSDSVLFANTPKVYWRE